VTIPAVKIPIERLEARVHSPENTPAAHAVKTDEISIKPNRCQRKNQLIPVPFFVGEDSVAK
jgi:hypothetical protein